MKELVIEQLTRLGDLAEETHEHGIAACLAAVAAALELGQEDELAVYLKPFMDDLQKLHNAFFN